jgi:hypothetical protein
MTGPILGAVVAILLGGTTEVAPTYYSQEAFIAVLLAAGASSGIALPARVAQSARTERVEVRSSSLA